MNWDWQRLLEKKNPEPQPGDRWFGSLIVEPSGQEQSLADTGVTVQAHAYTRCVAGMVLCAPGASGMTGTAADQEGLPQLLYGEKHKCAFCHGTGQVQGAHQCPVCAGAAKVGFIPPVVRCAFCSGGGRAPRRSNATCLACRGSGVIRVRPPIRICTKCKGSGRPTGQSLYCGSCHGSGVVTVPESYGSNDGRTYS